MRLGVALLAISALVGCSVSRSQAPPDAPSIGPTTSASGAASGPCRTRSGLLAAPERIVDTIGHPGQPEVNFDDVVEGPRGLLFVNTEENGYIIVVDSATGATLSFDAGHTKGDLPDKNENGRWAGDITDIEAWESGGHLVVLAAHAFPSEIYRFEVSLPASGLPEIGPADGRVVYANASWARVGSLSRGPWHDGRTAVLAGSVNTGQMVISFDDGLTWQPHAFLDAVTGLAGEQRKVLPVRYSTINDIDVIDGRWFLLLDRFAWLEAEKDFAQFHHFLNAVLVSSDRGLSWQMASIPANDQLAPELRALAEAEKRKKRLPAPFYDLLGEKLFKLSRAPDGTLLATTAMSNMAEPGLGGRILRSTDGGLTWSQVSHLDSRNMIVRPLPDGTLVLGTSTKTLHPPGGRATAGISVSLDGGLSFTHCYELASSTIAGHRDGLFVVAAVSVLVTLHAVWVGTASEGEHASLFRLPIG
jgi:hypothetical protein